MIPIDGPEPAPEIDAVEMASCSGNAACRKFALIANVRKTNEPNNDGNRSFRKRMRNKQEKGKT